uniref:Core domain-containing protein n=1 Tax=Arcella intermedia TaxID=1963864 RepID=A0A6B2LLP9_9EUKA
MPTLPPASLCALSRGWSQRTPVRSLHAHSLRPQAAKSPSLVRISVRPYTTQYKEGSVTLTDSAKRKLLEITTKKTQSGGAVYLRVQVDPGGCSGFLTKFKLDDAPITKDDRIFSEILEKQQIRVVLDSVSLNLLDGATIDFASEVARSAFMIAEIPKATSSCGCKVSFGVD